MGILSWIIFGALAGWFASLIVGTRGRQGCLFNIIIGVVGAFLGGIIMEFVTGNSISMAFNMRSFVVAVLGAVILLVITGAARKGK
ncbi:MAG: GlsB/YeaQ/YmgE family stress response membrane protein [Ardenticatenaceae bacterium]|nr:GlsB/YeaQ/YmgE family stress response membrane protein [Anaerolineales bacterium]MCB8923857.1 GlsB/YeaQ/YmgE family stress response membrane protein [Ardenticatenaceae bacterium]MCB9003364.1 GlsB/YeaQ/YmgE family stress response membrane protein [Ardenticatenaceae bacterium]